MVNNTASETRVERVYAALGDPARRAMVERLRRGPSSVSELGAPLGMTLAGVGKHVAVLEASGVIRTTKVGRVRSCELVAGSLDEAAAWIDETRAFWNAGVDRMIDHLTESA
jgi:DNA-binding transcriptional ArsR family regulator